MWRYYCQESACKRGTYSDPRIARSSYCIVCWKWLRLWNIQNLSEPKIKEWKLWVLFFKFYQFLTCQNLGLKYILMIFKCCFTSGSVTMCDNIWTLTWSLFNIEILCINKYSSCILNSPLLPTPHHHFCNYFPKYTAACLSVVCKILYLHAVEHYVLANLCFKNNTFSACKKCIGFGSY